ncbi:nucleoside deaminase [Nocardioides sp. CFH 31398]|uniref:nucleoside deaminase n=1 Tax=Nocardioides sp. CFH 31398 TaxID=2919579 RepID=UPI001F06A43C|nr:nucleoside deaminase [Nocardioides sp. CFH 31398]MCH1866556.1 nucleoside deaminase [Nocardioides sp. CFH 31398]
MSDPSIVTETDLVHLRRCVELAAQAVAAGDEAFGSVLVGADGTVLAEGRNEVAGGDGTRHPELELARWGAQHLAVEDRPGATVYTSGEHCAMCSAAHAWAGLGRIVFATSVEQTTRWASELGAPASPVAPLPIRAVAPGVPTAGPVAELADEVRELHRQAVTGEA